MSRYEIIVRFTDRTVGAVAAREYESFFDALKYAVVCGGPTRTVRGVEITDVTDEAD